MDNKKNWALSTACFVMIIALVATAYSLIPDGQVQQPPHALESSIEN